MSEATNPVHLALDLATYEDLVATLSRRYPSFVLAAIMPDGEVEAGQAQEKYSFQGNYNALLGMTASLTQTVLAMKSQGPPSP